MREIQALLRRSGITQDRDEGVRAGFQKGQAASDDEERKQEESVALHDRSGPKEQGARAEEEQADHQTSLVAVLAHDQRGGQGQQKIAQVESGLNQAGLEAVHLKRFHELLNEHVVQIAGDAPEEKQRRHQSKGQRVAWRKKPGLAGRLFFRIRQSGQPESPSRAPR